MVCTEKSSGIYKMILAHDDEVFAELCRSLTPSQKHELVKLADKILENIESE